MQNKDNLFDIIREKANNHEDPVPADAWENISRKKRRRRFGFFWPAMLLLLGGSLFIGYDQFFRNDGSTALNSAELSEQNVPSTLSKSQPVDQGAQQKLSQTADANDNDQSLSNHVNSHDVAGIQKLNTRDNDHQPIQNAGVLSNDVSKINGVSNSKENLASSSLPVVQASNNRMHDVEAGQVIRKKKSRKGKSALNMVVEQAETGDWASASNQSLSKPAVIQVDQVNEPVLVDITAKDHTEKLTEQITQIAEDAHAIQQKLRDSLLSKALEKSETIVTKKPDTDKQARKNNVSAELSLMPVFPITGQGRSVAFNRTLNYSNGKSEFSGALARATIDPSVAFTASARKSFNKKLSGGIGIQYLRLKEYVTISGVQLKTIYSYSDTHMNANDGTSMISDTATAYLQTKRDFKSVNTYTYLSVPVSVQYLVFEKGKWQVALDAGVNVNVSGRYSNNINRKLVAPLSCTQPVTDEKMNVNLSYFGGMRFDRRINQNMGLFLNPNILFSPVKQGITDRRIHRFGIGAGLAFRLH